MIHIDDVKQGTPEWHELRLYIPTASHFERILTPKKLAPSTNNSYLMEKLAQWAVGGPIDELDGGGLGGWTHRGTEMEEEAVTSYEFEMNVDTKPGGFFLRDDRMVGGSPDRLVGDDGVLEIKCPAAKTHIGYLLRGNVAEEYKCQVQGLLWITGRDWADVMSYSPIMPNSIVRMARDEPFIVALKAAVDAFVERLLSGREELRRRGLVPREPAPRGAASVSP